MHFTTSFLLLASATFVYTNPIEPRQQSIWNPYSPCTSCLRRSWTQGPECTTHQYLKSTISRLLNPPASETATYTPSQWCSAYLRQTDWSTQWKTTSLVSTYTSWSVVHLFVTKTDYDHPTSTKFCPSPSPAMECGWDSNTIAPLDQQEDHSIEHFQTPEECQQLCLERKACKAYRIDGKTNTYCEIFNVGLGKNASNVINPTPNGNQWWDRNCGEHVPTPCRLGGTASRRTPPPNLNPGVPVTPSLVVLTTDAHPATASITPGPALAKRDTPFPPYLKDLSYPWSSMYMIPACSCIVSSAGEPVASTTVMTATKWTSSTSVTVTNEDWFTVTETPRQTTVYVSVE
ncbi:uncharacterized protein K460DRAFT_406852 [Cucurbitaria berberidis CBS 394.84]|uniref:Apple domain-containing protein n=1 Tax=Cucurbitaria berberidis CBS 394.84 TaxID=1168544 RepID=A0A9P4GI86_9PLEO|nr:uncharacterized protein K460DRAFT_406852 [Cucurbitaria berberidis CBS 394.84]KAF1846658.1 hypothetical protein K460DRAFT_406852 [Cucurbitaria berberidis CBS 394.84]